jgi:hypothetical protein
MTKVESNQNPGTLSENIKHFEVDGNNVVAVFWNEDQASKFADEFFSVNNGVGCKHMQMGFVNFTYRFNDRVEANSTYHSTTSMIRMFENSLGNCKSRRIIKNARR